MVTATTGRPRFDPDLETWAEVLDSFPSLQAKLLFVTLNDYEVSEWAEFPPPNVEECWLWINHGHENWKANDAFPGLEKLELCWADTCELVDWPLRDLKELVLEGTEFNMDPADFPAVRENIEHHNVKVTINLYHCFMSTAEEGKWRTELEFWKSVKGVEVTGFDNLEFPPPEEFQARDPEDEED